MPKIAVISFLLASLLLQLSLPSDARAWFRKPPPTTESSARMPQGVIVSGLDVDMILPKYPTFSDTPDSPLNQITMDSVRQPSRLQMLFLGNFGYPFGKAKVMRRKVSKRQSGWGGLDTMFNGAWRSPYVERDSVGQKQQQPDAGATSRVRSSRRQNAQLCYVNPIACFGRRQLSPLFRRANDQTSAADESV